MVPLDKDLIEKKMLNQKKEWINGYHKKVYESLKRKMNRLEKKNLKMLVQLFKISFHSFS